MDDTTHRSRGNQRHRTRKDILAAASRLLKDGQVPTMEDVAAEALVSRATVYRYFPDIKALLLEAPLDTAVPTADSLFADDPSVDPGERLDRAEAALHEMMYRNEAQLRLMLANSLTANPGDAAPDAMPIRQNRRMPLIEEALKPVRQQLDKATYEKLSAALALIFGTESMIVFRDVLDVDPDAAREIKSWALRALVQSALEDSAVNRGSTAGGGSAPSQ
jgi:AcrR family transcriptional regulator